MIGCDVLDGPGRNSDYIVAYQYNGKVYATYGYQWSTGFSFTNYDSHANVIYI